MEKYEIGATEIKTVLVLVLTGLLAVAVYPYQIVILDFYLTVVFIFLSLYGIVGLWKIWQAAKMKVKASDLFPGLVEDRILVGFNILGFSYYLTIFGAMSVNQFYELVVLILAGLGLMWLSSRR